MTASVKSSPAHDLLLNNPDSMSFPEPFPKLSHNMIIFIIQPISDFLSDICDKHKMQQLEILDVHIRYRNLISQGQFQYDFINNIVSEG